MSNSISPIRTSITPLEPASPVKKVFTKGEEHMARIVFGIKGHRPQSAAKITKTMEVLETARSLKLLALKAIKSNNAEGIEKAIIYLQEAARFKDVESMLILGKLFLKLKNPDAAFPWLLKAARKFNPDAMASLAACLRHVNSKKHAKELIGLFNHIKEKSDSNKRAHIVNVNVELCLGMCYEKLIGTDKLKASKEIIKMAAIGCYSRAAYDGNKFAMCKLAKDHLKKAEAAIAQGENVQGFKEVYEAEGWYHRAGKDGLAEKAVDKISRAYRSLMRP